MMEKIRRLYKEAEEIYMKQGYEKALCFLEPIYEEYCEQIDFVMLKAICLHDEGKLEEAKQELLAIYPWHQTHYELNYNIAMMCYGLGQVEESLLYFVRAIYCDLDNERTDTNEEINARIMELCEDNPEHIKLFNETLERVENDRKRIQDAFPIKRMSLGEDQMYQTSELYLGDYFEKNGLRYYTGLYDYYYEERDGIDVTKFCTSPILYKVETLVGQAQKVFEYTCQEKTTFAIMVHQKQVILIDTQSEQHAINNMLPNRFYYYTFQAGDQIRMVGIEPFVISKPMKHQRNKQMPKVVIQLFVDGLSYDFLKKNDWTNVMPYTYKFFKEGTICTNAYSNSEWTYPSLASYVTGYKTTNHGLFHSSYNNENLWHMDSYIEEIQKQGFICSRFDGDWRSTPRTGYAKGMDRFVYQEAVRSSKAQDNIAEAIDQMQAFSDCNQFLWIGVPDLHDTPDELQPRMSIQVKQSLEERIIHQTTQTSVQKQFDGQKVNRYKRELRRLDETLEQLYHYLQMHYDEKEYVISIMSDHGQGFVVDRPKFFMDDYRTNVAMMFRGGNTPKGTCAELMDSTDYYEHLSEVAGLHLPTLGESNRAPWFGGTKEREYIYTESIHENRYYQGMIRTHEYGFYFATTKMVEDDGMVSLENLDVHLISMETGEECTKQQPQLVQQWLEVVKNHMKKNIKI